MSIPFFRYGVSPGPEEDRFIEVIRDVLRRGAFIMQADLSDFERRLEEFLGAGTVIGVANGTDALILALRAAGVGSGDEVIMPSHTYVATAAAAHFLGATPVLVDCGDDHLIAPPAISAAVTPRTSAVVPVHLNGRTCDMAAVMEIARAHELLVIEDAAQAVGARYQGQAAGTFGDA